MNTLDFQIKTVPQLFEEEEQEEENAYTNYQNQEIDILKNK